VSVLSEQGICVGAKPGSDIEVLVQQGRDRLKQIMPSGGPRLVIVLAVLALVGLGAWTAYFTVPSDSQRFGKYLKEVPPGLHFKLPLGIDVANIVPDKRQLKQEFGFATPGATDPYQTSRDGKRETQIVGGSSYAHHMRDAIAGDRIVKEKGWKPLGEAGVAQTDSVAGLRGFGPPNTA
jgi:membrane protease subunit HflK